MVKDSQSLQLEKSKIADWFSVKSNKFKLTNDEQSKITRNSFKPSFNIAFICWLAQRNKSIKYNYYFYLCYMNKLIH